jgi:hypothetical protein
MNVIELIKRAGDNLVILIFLYLVIIWLKPSLNVMK